MNKNHILLNTLRIVGLLEGISYLLLLFIAMPLKYFFQLPQFVRVIGMAHGVLFIAYIVLVMIAAQRYKWNIKNTSIALIGSLLPFGTFYADKKVFQKEA
jgi:integral membrane protein